jgi:CheY-like chemotaxis protein
MDIMMPELDGIETYKKIQEMNPDIPVVALTVYASENQKKKLLKMGFREHLSKPLKKNKLLEAVSSFV